MWTTKLLILLLKVRFKNYAALDSRMFILRDFSSDDHDPYVNTFRQYSPHLEASDWTTDSGFKLILAFCCSSLNLLSISFVPPCINNPNELCCWKSLLHTSLSICFLWRYLTCKGAEKIANTVEFRLLRRLDNSLIVASFICRSFWHHLDINSNFPLGSDNAISAESITIYLQVAE